MNFGDGAVGANVANAKGESGIELGGIEEFEKSALGIDAGDDGFDGDFFAIGEHDAGDGAVFDADVLNFGIGADFRAGCFAGRFSESASERAEPSARKSGRADGMRNPRRRASSSTAVDPADQGPRAVPKMPRAAMTARSNSVSKNSATKSATAMGPQRRRSKMPFLPRLRTLRPVLKRFQRSSGEA